MGDLIEELTEYGRHLQREIDEAEIRELRIQIADALARGEKERARGEKERARAEEERARIRDYESKILLLEKENAELKVKLATPTMIAGEETRREARFENQVPISGSEPSLQPRWRPR